MYPPLTHEMEWLGRSATAPTAHQIDVARLEREARQVRAAAVKGALSQIFAGFGPAIKRIAAAIVAGQRRRSTVSELRQLDDRLLSDIGISRADIDNVAKLGGRLVRNDGPYGYRAAVKGHGDLQVA
jgi:uncharacterized protein YjiS (DUF1127 family)